METIYKLSIFIFQIVLVRYLYNLQDKILKQKDDINTLKFLMLENAKKQCYKCSNFDIDENV